MTDFRIDHKCQTKKGPKNTRIAGPRPPPAKAKILICHLRIDFCKSQIFFQKGNGWKVYTQKVAKKKDSKPTRASPHVRKTHNTTSKFRTCPAPHTKVKRDVSWFLTSPTRAMHPTWWTPPPTSSVLRLHPISLSKTAIFKNPRQGAAKKKKYLSLYIYSHPKVSEASFWLQNLRCAFSFPI